MSLIIRDDYEFMMFTEGLFAVSDAFARVVNVNID
jgi:hypothetical protein